MDRKTFIKEVYSSYWLTAREKRWGFTEYDKGLCKLVSQHIQDRKTSLLEIGIGTGYPFGKFFLNKGYSVYGIDLATRVVQKCKRLYPAINCVIADAENIPYKDSCFDLVICFHSTMYFPDLNKAVDEMLRVTRTGGYFIFDIENKDNKEVEDAYQLRIKELQLPYNIIRYAKNTVKFVLGRGLPRWYSVVHEVPTYPRSVYKHLRNAGVHKSTIVGVESDDSIEIVEINDSLEQYLKVVFIVKKEP